MVAAPSALSPLLETLEDGGKGTLLCAFDGGTSKTLFCRRRGRLSLPALSLPMNSMGSD